MAAAIPDYPSPEWISATDARHEVKRFHATEPTRLFAYHGNGLDLLVSAITGGVITCGLLVFPNDSHEPVDQKYLQFDLKRLKRGFDAKLNARIYLLRGEVDQLIGKAARPASAESARAQSPESPVSAKQSRKRSQHAQPQRTRARKVLQRLYPNGLPTQDDVPNSVLLKAFSAKYQEMVNSKELLTPPHGEPSSDTVLREAGRKD